MKTIKSLSRIIYDITEPIKIESEMNFKSFNLFAGMNGVGKTFVLKTSYAFIFLSAAIINKQTKEALIGFAQFIFDNTFDDQNINGVITSVFEQDDATIRIEFEEGRVLDITYSGFEEIDTAIPAMFMSSGMRLFDAISVYLKLRKVLLDSKNIDPKDDESILQEMLQHYKIYDVMHIERMMKNCPRPISANIINTLKNDYEFKEDIAEFDYDEDKCDFYVIMSNGVDKKYMTTYGSGHQAIFNMIINQT